MHPRTLAWLSLLVGLLAGTITGQAAEADPELAAAEKILHQARVDTDGPSLLAFFRKRTLSAAAQAKLAALVRQLGAPSFKVRQKASQELRLAGRPSVPFLRPAENDSDLEIATRARQCLHAIDQGADQVLLAAAARVLAARKPAGAAQVLLAYLPLEAEESVEEAVVNALAVVGIQAGKADLALTAALAARESVVRAAAAFVLGKVPEQRSAVRRLLADPDAKVRFVAARALFQAGDKTAVAALILLLSEAPETIALQAEDLLCRLLGDKAPPGVLDTRNAAARRQCVQAWKEWWQANEAKVDLARLTQDNLLLGFTLICEAHLPNGQGRVYGCALDHKPRWQLPVHNPIDAQVLPGQRILVANCNSNQVVEMDRRGKVLWSYKVELPVSCQRLPNGNTFIGTYASLLEVTRAGKTVFSYPKTRSIFCAVKLRNGHIIYVHSNGRMVELDAGGKEVRSIRVGGTGSWGGVEPLPNGNYLVAQCDRNRVVEIDPAGKEVWHYGIHTPSLATRLRNGRILISSIGGRKCVEIDRSSKQIYWEHKVQGRLFRVRRY